MVTLALLFRPSTNPTGNKLLSAEIIQDQIPITQETGDLLHRKKIARSLRQHRELILNYFRAGRLISSGVVEGLNNKAKVTMSILRLSHIPGAGTGPRPLTWQAAQNL